MFIDVTRYGGLRIQRVAIAAIAYLDEVLDGCAIHLIGGETLRVNEDMAEIEQRACAVKMISAVEFGDRRVEYSPPIAAPSVPAPAGFIDPEKERQAIDILERAQLISPADAVERRVETITPASRQQGRQRRGNGR